MKARYLVLLTVVLLAATLLGMRYNNLTAYEMRDNLLEQDAAGEEVQDELQELQDFVFSHMNASGPGGMRFRLGGAYQQAQTEAEAALDAAVDGSVYEEATRECDREGQAPAENAECVQDYVEQRLDESAGAGIEMPEPGEFTYVFYSPRWTPDLPGISLLLAVLSSFMALVLYVRHWVQKLGQSG